LESIATQSLIPQEVVICDDRSTDGTIRIVQEFARQVPFRVRLEINDKNIGSTLNFERAIKLCQGDLIALCDQDDIWYPEKLAIVTRVLSQNPEVGYVFSDAELVDENGKALGATLWRSVGLTSGIIGQINPSSQFAALLRRSFVTGAAMCFR